MNSRNPAVVVKNNNYRTSKFREIKAKLIEYKGGKCSRCGIVADETNQCIFDFHHIDPAKKEGKIQHTSLEVAMREVDKTILLCSNCHKITHFLGRST